MIKVQKSFVATTLTVLLLITSGLAQRETETISVPGSIVTMRCLDCPDLILRLPEPGYPELVGYGAHRYDGDVSVRITIVPDGTVSHAKAVSGHDYFRPILEAASLRAVFGPVDRDVIAVITYRITPSDERQLAKVPLGIVNGRAKEIPKPFYTKELERLCATGKVEVRIGVSKDGNVEYAIPISGDPLLFSSATSTAFRSEFNPIPHGPVATEGILSLDFAQLTRCLDVGIVNKKIRTMALPSLTSLAGHGRIAEPLTLDVRITVDLAGNVVAAKALGGHPLIRAPFEKAALSAKFEPTLINAKPFLAKGFIRFKISKAGRSATSFTKIERVHLQSG